MVNGIYVLTFLNIQFPPFSPLFIIIFVQPFMNKAANFERGYVHAFI